MQISKTLIFVVLLLSCGCCASVVDAQSAAATVHPNFARGNGSDKYFDRTQWDNINLFNGELNLPIPLGQWYPLRESFGYQLVLSYNSNIWDYKQTSSTVTAAFPNRNSNAGAGWDLSLGRLIDPFDSYNGLGKWVYVSPDGGLHPFYSSLHYDVVEPEDNVFYTRDGTYYRLQQLNQTTAIVESSDGTVRTFEFANNDWRLIKIADRFTNYLAISYATANTWTLTDNHGRTQTIYFKADPTGTYPLIVDRVVVTSFAGGTATYTFAYTTGTVTRSDVDNDAATSATINQSLLASVTQPDGSKYSFSYHPVNAASDASGRLASMQLPTLGKLEWTYQKYNFTSPSCASTLAAIYRTNAGVASRKMTDMAGGTAGLWSFTPTIKTLNDPAKCADEGEMTNTVTTPVGDKTVNYFSVNAVGTGSTLWNRSEYALPFTKNVADGPLPTRINVAQAINGATATASSTYSAGYPESGAINGDRKGLNWGNGGGWNDATAASPPPSDTVWVEDNLPSGATTAGNSEDWNWVSSNPSPVSGTLAHQSNIVAGTHQHYFYGATNTLTVDTGDKLVAYVYLDPVNPPTEVMLQWADTTWEHRAYWGADQLPWGTNGTNSRRYMGALPPVGQWVRLEVPASSVGLENQQLTAMAFSLFNGRATWDHAGKVSTGYPDWIQVNFNGSKTIGEINVFTLQDNYGNPIEPTIDMTFSLYGLTSFEVQYWNGSAWITLANKAGNNKVWNQFIFSPVTTDKIRVYITGTTNTWSRVTEIEALTPPSSNTTRFLSKQIFDCDANANTCQLLQSQYTRYEQDGATDPAYADVVNVNRREASQRTTYHDDVENGVARFASVDRSEFNGLGQFRKEVTNGNFGSGDVREQTTDYNASTGTYPSAGFVMPATNQAWLINIYGKQKKVEGTSSQVTEVCYDRATGFAKRQRVWWSTDPAGTASSKDVLVVYTPDAAGQTIKEQYYGGDVQLIDTSSLCTMPLPNADQYQIQHAYQYGSRSTSQYYTASGSAFGTKFMDRDVDRSTGGVKTSRDSAGLATQYEYDQLGRITWTKPGAGQGAWTQYYRTLADGANNAKTFIYKKENGTGAVLTYKADVQDSFGRVWLEQTSMPDGTYPNRITLRNAMGWRTHTTEYNNGNPRYTVYYDHDPFGRPKAVVPPDGQNHNIYYQYAGFRSVTTTVPVATSYDKTTGQINETPRSTTKVYDRQNRLWKEINHVVDSFGSARDVVTTYSYNFAGQILETKRDGVRMGSLRSFDGRGFLTSEFTEDGKVETLTYLDIDPLGDSRRNQRLNHSSGTVIYLSYDYDRAGRLIKVRDPNDSTKVWKEFTYADTNGTNDWRAGKLWTTKRNNDMSRFLGSAGVTIAAVSETYTYGGVGGAVSKYETEFSDSLGRYEKFSQSYSYTELGDVSEMGYPNSTANSSVTIGRDRKITYSYRQGLLTTISGTYNSQPENWATSIDYHPTGLLKQLVHANGVTDNIGQDPNGFARPASVSTARAKYAGTATPYDFNSGAFQYDGAGVIAKVGAEFFVAEQGWQPPAPPNPPPSISPCENGWQDPLGAVYAMGDSQCNARIFYYYTAGDRLYKVEDGVYGAKNWYFYNLSGQPLTVYSTAHAHYQAWPSLWQYTRDYIYRDGQRFVVDEKRRDEPTSPVHYHLGFGSAGTITDAGGMRIEN